MPHRAQALRDLQVLRKQSGAARGSAEVEYEDEDMLPADIAALAEEFRQKMMAMPYAPLEAAAVPATDHEKT